MSIQNRNIVQIAVICNNTLAPFHLAPDLFWCWWLPGRGSWGSCLWSPLMLSFPGAWPLVTGQGGGVSSPSLPYTPCTHQHQESQQTGQLHQAQHLLVSFIPSVTRSPHHSITRILLHYPGHAPFIRCDLVWDARAVSDGWRLIFPGQRHRGGRGNGSPRLLMSRWGSAQTQSWSQGQHLLIFHPVHLHNKQETHQVSQPTLSLWFSPKPKALLKMKVSHKRCDSKQYKFVLYYSLILNILQTTRPLLALFFLMRRIHEIFRVKREVKRQWEWIVRARGRERIHNALLNKLE